MPPQQYNQPPQPQAYGQNTQPLKSKQRFLLPFVVAVVLALVFVGLFFWAYTGMQSYKGDVTPKIAAAVKVAVQNESSRKDNEFLEKEKSPVKTFIGPDTYGGITFSYPKTWSSYVVQSETSMTPLDGYFHPDVVPDIAGKTSYALRVRVLNKTYAEELKTFESKIKSGKIKLVAYTPGKQKAVVGARLDGEVNTGQKDHMIVLPLRDKTIEISTESDQFQADFEKIVLDSLNFTP